MSPLRLKKRLQKELRAKRNRDRRPFLIACLLLVGLSGTAGYLLWKENRPVALLQQGIRLEQQQDLDPALLRYRKLFRDYHRSAEAPVALFRSGQILQNDLGDDQRALLLYLRLEQEYPQSELVSRAQQAAAELTKHRLDDCGQAIPIYQRLVEQSGSAGDRYQYEIADCYLRLENWSQAAIEFEILLGNYPLSELRPTANYRLAEARVLNRQRPEARSAFEQIVRDYPDSAMDQEARFRLAEMLEEDERLNDALRAYSELTRYPRQKLLKKKILHLKERIARKKKVL